MQLGFVIDHSRCIGCHACTVACKAENDVPVGEFRTWVKYTETGHYPSVKRHFAVLRCNQCSDAPCMTICPTSALDKLANGIVDVDPKLCIGCKSCMQGCPYDALYIHPEHGTAQKCHFCAHRAEIGLAPACAVVCPTEAIIPGDFDDPTSVVSRMKADGGLDARKVEAGTRPNVWYREVDASGIDPALTTGAGGYLWSERRPGPQVDAELAAALEQKASSATSAYAAPSARTVYDVDQRPMWGWRVSAYLLTKAAAAGALLVGLPLAYAASGGATAGVLTASVAALALLVATTVLLVADLKRPERFLLILVHPNWSSWVCRGAVVLTAYGALLALWTALALFDHLPGGALAAVLGAPTAVVAALTAAYTAWLFGQARGRVLWMQRGLAPSLVLHAALAGAALLLLLAGLGAAVGEASALRWTSVALLAAFWSASPWLRARGAPAGRADEYERALRVLAGGQYAKLHRLALALGALAPLALLLALPGVPAALALAGVLVLAGLYLDGDLFVRAGQALPIS